MLGLDFTVQAADIAEAVAPGLPPEETVMSLAAQKAAAVKGCMGDSQRTIVGADTVVFFSESDFWQTEILSGGLFHAVGFVGQHPSGVYRRMYPFRQRARVALF